MAAPLVQTSFASGEWAPKLRSRVDVQKYHAGAALMRNFFVDYSGGGASTRSGTQFIAQAATNGCRLIPFQASSTLSYILEFGQNTLRFYSNGAQIVTAPNTPYQISTPYNLVDLFPNQATSNPGLKYVQDANSLIICHPNYPPCILTINAATNWTLTIINFGSTITAPTGVAGSSNLGAGSWNYAYLVTAVDANGQESAPSSPATLNSLTYIGTVVGTNTITWTASPGAVSYNVYKAAPNEGAAVVGGAQFGFVSNVDGTSYTDSFPGTSPDFSQTPPVLQNPFSGASVASLALGTNSSYTTVPTVTIAAPSSGVQATAYASLGVSNATINHAGSNNDIITTGSTSPVGATISLGNGVFINITSVLNVGVGVWEVTGFTVASAGSITSGSTPSNPVSAVGPFPSPILAVQCTFNLTWHIGSLNLISGGQGYTSTPSVAISGGATATATLGPASAGNPGSPGFFQERLILANQPKAVQGYEMSQPGSFFNFNISNPSQPDDAISGTIISEELNDIRWLIPVPTGIIAGTGRGAWTINGGGGISTLNPITPSNQAASPQAFNGANDLRPQKINFDVIYGTNKGGYFRDLTYNIYANIFTGTDITTMSNHLFFGHFFLDLAWAEEPFKTLWVVRDDGIMLSCAFVKEQELIGWAHHDTNGQFKSVCSVIETTNGNTVDAVYVIVERIINGSTVQYVERMVDRYFPYGAEDAWSVDCGLQTSPGTGGVNSNSTATFTGVNTVGSSVTINFAPGNPVFGGGNVGEIIRASGGLFTITAVNTNQQVVATVNKPAKNYNPYTNTIYPDPFWTVWNVVSSVSGLTQLIGQQVVGVADGVAIGPYTVSGGGSVTLGLSASKITLGLAFLPQLKTLPADAGEPSIQTRRKKLPAVNLRVADTLGLQVGTSFANCVNMKDFQLGVIPSTSNGVVKITDLINQSSIFFEQFDIPQIDGRQILDQVWQVPGQICIQQTVPYPATILGVMPEITPGDTAK